MKKLSIEEKAKAYDEILDVARHIYADPSVKDEDKYYIESLFPELAESEDEKIRKEIINYFEHYPNIIVKRERRRDWIAWLEKVGNIIKEWGDLKVRYIQDDLQEMVDLKQKTEQGEQKPNKCMYSNDNYTDEERKVLCDGCDEDCKLKQKPADKVEPKFKIGDTVTVKPMSCHGNVFKGKPFKIVDIIEDNYVSDDEKTYSISLQDGLELVEQKPTGCPEYCVMSNCANCPYRPVLIKKPVEWSDKNIEMAVGILNYLCFSTDATDLEGFDEWYDWLKSITKEGVLPQPKQEWSEYDKMMFASIMNVPGLDEQQKEWLVTCSPRPKQEWSKEDKEMLKIMESCLHSHPRISLEEFNKCYSWLKSLRPQNRWKPSDEQMKALWDSIPEDVKEISEREMLLNELYKDLKKLREE